MTSTTNALRLIDLKPDRGMYKPGEAVTVFLEIETDTAGEVPFTIQIYHHVHPVVTLRENRELASGINKVSFTWQPPLDAPAGYGVRVSTEGSPAEFTSIETAFDVLPDWTRFPRYGYLCDFSPSRGNEQETMQRLAGYHINGLQFYDWQYRHDELLAPLEQYRDPLDRPLSLKTIRKLLDTAHQHGMAANAYLAVYAASAAFWRSHPVWMLYDEQHRPIPFGDDFLGIMNPAAGGGWQRHLLEECRKVLHALPFDGLHIDQYGEPKTGFDQDGLPVDLPKAFVDFIEAAVEQNPGRPVLFNAVGNWPIADLTVSPTSFNYIEIWPPDIHYTDLVRIVRNARQLSGEKPVVIALYLPAVRQVNNRLADALIYSAGGTRIEVGENERLLADPYFPKHEDIPSGLRQQLRRQADLMVRYEEWIGPLLPEATLPEINLPEGVAAFFRKGQPGASISLVNLAGKSPLCWNEEHPAPDPLTRFEVEIHLEQTPKNVCLVSPDNPSLDPVRLNFFRRGKMTVIAVPRLELWDVLLFKY